MALNDHTRFKGVTKLHKDNLSNNLLYGTIDFLKWGFLKVGGFQNITPAVSSALSPPVSRARLRPVDDPSYDEGQVWSGYRNDWVWETGVGFTVEPIRVSGVWIDSTFAYTSGIANSHYIDYPCGCVVFDTAISTDSVVEASFSHRIPGIYSASEPGIQQLLFDSWDMGTLQEYTALGSGVRNQLYPSVIQLPAVGVEVVQNTEYKPYQLGGGQWVYNDVLFHIFSDNEETCRDIQDAIAFQNDRTIWIYNRGTMKEHANYPNIQLDSFGSPTSTTLMYPEIVAPTGDGGFRWRKVVFTNTRTQTMEPVNNWLYRSVVRTTFEAVMPNI